MYVKDFPVQIKAVGPADGLKEGEYRAIVSAFNNVDDVGDVVIPGAFTDDLTEWEAKEGPIPVIWSHDWLDPFSHIGSTVQAEEIPQGLKTHAALDLDNPKASQVYRLLKGRRVTQFSFAYDIVDGGWGEREGRQVYELRKLAILEHGPCLVGCNRDTELLAVKARQLAARAKHGTVIDLAAVRQVRDALTGLLDTGEDATTKNSGPTAGRDASTADAATQSTGQPADTTTEDQPRAAEKSSAESQSARSAQVAARLSLLTLTNGDTQ